ncbi:Prolyl tripeptidyl peptidase precursor [Gemmata obscuriglobus]|uniref:Prolyl oligopeptidase n=1 Tax=Gemmata obscuriglobus TaxID=114 RepID=A0A2Z3H4D6_9BACT|nr:prolyl oligopeptidase family serine peptidase [Gemmata obscuriglobus]AWM40628.1 prolyl oligopeptidase [Gemmata obscuriglobus]QEG26110.1 Prolyl tripeptidyl peptidase precursor [Gemmata obscuriglobus]VTS00613.1 glutamyl peptidase : Glutamyl peptidase OS=uncultured Acidobacteria bacterium GN=HGMM_F17D01C19 PE=4 SV=1: Peptidase_S9 [Gemmata obscuriglobus UQM 2246]
MLRAFLCGVFVLFSSVDAFGQDGYQKPPQAVLDILDAPAPPGLSVSPTGEHILLVQTARYPSIEEVAAPMLRLAGLRINPKTNGPARPARATGLALLPVTGGEPKALALPEHGRIGFPLWAPDGKRFAVENFTDAGIELWVCALDDPKLEPVKGVRLSAAVGSSVQWMPDGRSLLVQLVPDGRGEAPRPPAAPVGPVVQESGGTAAPVRTYQDLLKDPHDAALFEYYCTSQLAVVSGEPGNPTVRNVGRPAINIGSDPSPDGQFVLAFRAQKPFSYLHPYTAFPRAVEVFKSSGERSATVAELPLQDKVPIEGVPTGPRAIRWVPTLPHALIWAEARDDGDPKKKVPHRDAIVTATVGGEAVTGTELMKVEHRFAGLDFFPTGNRMLVRDYDRDRKWGRTFLAASSPVLADEPKLLFERSVQDRYGDPGAPLLRQLPSGHSVIRTAGDPAGDTIFMKGDGASPKGDRPFLDRYDLRTQKAERLFHCPEGSYEEVVRVLNGTGTKLLVRRESVSEPPNYFFRDGPHEKPLTTNADPAPELRKAKKQLVTTKRADGTAISFTLHLPPGHKDGEKVPGVFYAYPVEFASADTAGQVTGSPHRFTAVSGYSHLFFLTQGYAVMEVSMPIVGPPETANNNFVDQLNANAKAALDKAAELGVDPARVGVMGHSYGAFMTANLLAHGDLFKAGIARSGAYNRTLTPFGFQNERRTFWEAPEVYGRMSPFYYADKIKEPLLLIHGAADSNPGTFPVQSERMYQAVRGAGGTVRLVLLPHEDHGYAARESIGHVLYEQIAWFDRYVKGAKK